MDANRWLHIKHPDGFSDSEFVKFKAACKVFAAFVVTVLGNWYDLGETYPPPKYEFLEPEISQDRKILTLPLGGEFTLGTRAIFENSSSYLLWQFFPYTKTMGMEEGLTEWLNGAKVTNWRKALWRSQQGAQPDASSRPR